MQNSNFALQNKLFKFPLLYVYETKCPNKLLNLTIELNWIVRF